MTKPLLVLAMAATLPAEVVLQFADRAVSREELGTEGVRKASSIVGPLFADRYVAAHGLELTDAEFAAMRRKMNAASPRKLEGPIPDRFFRQIAQNWKLQRALWRKHGGRVVLSAFGAHVANDAMAAEFRALEQEGVLRFYDAAVRLAFFEHLDKMPGDGVVSGEKARAIWDRPLWE